MSVWCQKSSKNLTFPTMYINLYVPKRGSILGSFVGTNDRVDLRDLTSIFPSKTRKEAQNRLISSIYLINNI